jgi:hypothetical protein
VCCNASLSVAEG